MRIMLALAILVGLVPSIATSDPEEGWDVTNIDQLSDFCSMTLLNGAKRGYAEEAKAMGNPNPKPFPEKQLREPLEKLCSCASQETAKYIPFSRFNASGGREFMGVLSKSISEGTCKPEGMLKAFFEKGG